jgi:thiol-disulfide isomerase/thioredoxin
MKKISAPVLVFVALVAAAGGYAVYRWQASGDTATSASNASSLWLQPLRDAAGAPHTLSQWRGKVLIVNFWATWCAPCREEIPLFVKLQREYGDRGIQFVGIAIDEPAKVQPFAQEFGINYPVMVGGMDTAEWSRRLGNGAGALPFTLIVGRDGVVRATHVGAMKEGALLPYIHTLL